MRRNTSGGEVSWVESEMLTFCNPEGSLNEAARDNGRGANRRNGGMAPQIAATPAE